MDRQPSGVFEPSSRSNDKQRAALIEWLNSTLSNVSLPINASDEELRAFLIDGSVLCQILNTLKPGSITEFGGSDHSSKLGSENVRKFLAAMGEMGLPRFQIQDLEKGSMKIVVECLLTLGAQFIANYGGYSTPNTPKTPNTSSASPSGNDSSVRWKPYVEQYGYSDISSRLEDSRTYNYPTLGEQKGASDSKFQRTLRNPVMSDPSAALLHHVGHKFHEVFQTKQGSYADLPPAQLSEMMKSNSLDNAPTQSLLSVVNGILDEGVERKNGEIPYRVACLLKRVVQEIERRISTQAEHLRTQNNLFKAREEKYQSRIRVLEALATGMSNETLIKKTKIEERKKVEEQDNNHHEIASLKKELEIAKKNYEQLRLQRDREAKEDHENVSLKQELKIAMKNYEQRCLHMETEAKRVQQELEETLKEVGSNLTESRIRVQELEACIESKSQFWNNNEHTYQKFTDFQFGALRELKLSSQTLRHEIIETQKTYAEDFNHLGKKFGVLKNAADNYYALLAENRKLHNEVQDLKGNIRVYCRIRPFLPGQMGKHTIVEHVGEDGELIVINPSKQEKESRRSFKFNKVYGPATTQVNVYSDMQPLIQSVLDGYNVCIFAYGQTGSGKTYTMTGPDGASEEDWGVNYRALNDLFRISQTRKFTYTYEIGVQMVEIYNEQVRDLLSSGGSQKNLGILTTSQPSGLAVPDASMYPVQSTSDVFDLMEIGMKNRAKGSTAINERSSRSHSVLTIHARGMDLKARSFIRGCLHLVDLAGSERVDRSEVTGDRLKEAQHINKSLSALGDVIFALAQKRCHVPYRNSKLTQVLQSSLGGQAKTLMFVQLNPEVRSFSESLSTLKFAERVSGVELGAARSSKECRDVRELMDQVVSLKDTMTKKDEEIARLQLLKDFKTVHQKINGERRATSSPSYGSSSIRSSVGGIPQRGSKAPSSEKISGATSDLENCSDNSDNDFKHRKESLKHSKSVGGSLSADVEILGSGDGESEERLSDLSDSGLSIGTDTEGSEGAKPSERLKRSRSTVRIPRPSLKSPTTPKSSNNAPKRSTGLTKSSSETTLASKPTKRWQ